MSQHTPTPWTATFPITAAGKRDAWVISGGRRSIALMPDTADMQNDEANAAFIVRACNSHDALVKALEKLSDALDELQSCTNPKPGYRDDWECALNQAENARAYYKAALSLLRLA
jgi:hypothetical protein